MRRAQSLLSPTGLWDTGFQFGDWLDPTAPPDAAFKAKADSGVVATACFYRSADLVARTATVLGHDDDAASFRLLADRTRAAFTAHYVHADGLIRSDAPTVYALAIAFDLLDPETSDLAGRRLARLVADGGYHIQTGFAGTPFISDALTRTGHLDVAYRLLLQRECPSWLYPVTMGATTIWERWDSMLPDGTVNPGEMTQLQPLRPRCRRRLDAPHHRGISPLQPGYARVRVAPRPGGGLTWARASLATAYGTVAVSWEQTDGAELTVDVTVPEGVTAQVWIGSAVTEVGAGEHHLGG